MKHTAGKWTVYKPRPTDNPGIEADGFTVVLFGEQAETDCGIHGRTPEEADANAKLMAAASVLLKALHGGPGAQHKAMPSNLRYFAELLSKPSLASSDRDIIIDCLRKYADTIDAAILEAE